MNRRLASILPALLLAACGGGENSSDAATVLSKVDITPSSATLGYLATAQLTATAIYLDGHRVDVSRSSSWTSAAPSRWTVNAQGLATSVAAGTAQISASYGGRSGSTTLTAQQPIIAWGDSLTCCNGATEGHTYPDVVAADTGRSVINLGVSSQDSREIIARQGGQPALLSFDGDQLKASGSTAVSDFNVTPITQFSDSTLRGSISGIPGTLSGDGTQLSFLRDTAGNAITAGPNAAFVPDNDAYRDGVNLFWIGNNNFSDAAQVLSDTAAAVAYLRTQNYLILSLFNTTEQTKSTSEYQQVIGINQQLAQRYGTRYIDVRAIVIAAYDPSSPQDVQDHDNDVMPTSLSYDDEHLNDKGYKIVGDAVAQRLKDNGSLVQ